jgi:hypothetical protein
MMDTKIMNSRTDGGCIGGDNEYMTAHSCIQCEEYKYVMSSDQDDICMECESKNSEEHFKLIYGDPNKA